VSRRITLHGQRRRLWGLTIEAGCPRVVQKGQRHQRDAAM
jgi:hypothetical protein